MHCTVFLSNSLVELSVQQIAHVLSGIGRFSDIACLVDARIQSQFNVFNLSLM